MAETKKEKVKPKSMDKPKPKPKTKSKEKVKPKEKPKVKPKVKPKEKSKPTEKERKVIVEITEPEKEKEIYAEKLKHLIYKMKNQNNFNDTGIRFAWRN